METEATRLTNYFPFSAYFYASGIKRERVEPDNVDAYQNSSGFSLTAADQLVFNQWLAQQAHSRGLSIGLKNDVDQVVQLQPYFDWALNEQCFEYVDKIADKLVKNCMKEFRQKGGKV